MDTEKCLAEVKLTTFFRNMNNFDRNSFKIILDICRILYGTGTTTEEI